MAEKEEDDEVKKEYNPRGGFEQSAFDNLEREFQDVLQELQNDRSLDRFRVEYEKLHRALKKSHESEKRLIKKCRELNNEIVQNAAKVQNALSMNEEDQNLIIALKQEIDKAWKMVDASQEKEAKAKENIQHLKLEIANLSGIVEQGVTLTMGNDTQVNDLEQEKEELSRERDRTISALMDVKKDLQDWQEKAKSAEADKINLEHDIGVLKDQLSAKRAECDREMKKKERLEREVKELKNSLDSKQNEVKEKMGTMVEQQEVVAKLETTLREQKAIVEKAVKDFELANQKVLKMQGDLEEQINNNTQLLAENSQKQVELKLKEDEIESFKQEIVRVNKVREATVNKLKVVEKQKEEVERQREDLTSQTLKLEKDVEAQRKLAEQERKRLEESLRERDVLNKMKTQAEDQTQKQADLVKINEVAVHNLELEINMYKYAAVKQDKEIEKLEIERQKFGAEASKSATNFMKALDEVRNREMNIMELQKKLLEAESKIKHQQNLYETVRTERNLYSKNLVQAQDEIDEMKRKFKVMAHLVEQLKEEVTSRDNALMKEHAEHLKVEKEREALKGDLSRVNRLITEAEAKITENMSQIENLNHIISEADDEQARQKKEMEVIKGERDILSTQLIRRNEELTLLYEKIRIEQSTLLKGQIQYRDRLDELRVLKIKLTDHKRELALMHSSCKNVDVLKKEIHNLGRELIQERTKVRALSEELESPMNVHRWRKLEGTDPSKYEMIVKIQTLQKRLILKTEEVVEKDLLIQEKEKLYIELRNILARQPGPEAQEQLTNYARTIEDKTRQLKAMASELQMCQVHIGDYKKEIQTLNEELLQAKEKYFELRRNGKEVQVQNDTNMPLQSIALGV
ncbi:cilia- and flagella-associated protein 58 [Marchantia polymorpha subsp. ruderalis]|uniref:Cilia- and flagella-associated protein 58 central coiled coil domain-containing protein n=2 Tax=Marchantia polymorpha TaxID=3197 RepID=A0AAF6BMT3_MARPO|nr:hypothetical protein MARPO_0035s0040 [Marchantia polymorpha]BBN13317.1 hypothetical protein Mp_6g02530 [Marchantia polymorpha subsp. ruderalis]|eukprot:PTQ41245.1 hypothetical protein MARPO_0035s0040 [Marchantia polymorpha]